MEEVAWVEGAGPLLAPAVPISISTLQSSTRRTAVRFGTTGRNAVRGRGLFDLDRSMRRTGWMSQPTPSTSPTHLPLPFQLQISRTQASGRSQYECESRDSLERTDQHLGGRSASLHQVQIRIHRVWLFVYATSLRIKSGEHCRSTTVVLGMVCDCSARVERLQTEASVSISGWPPVGIER